jgi:hypothetical protein
VTAYKPADDGKGYVVRLFAGAGKDVHVKLAWDGKQPSAIYMSDSLETRGEKIADAIDLRAWAVVTLRVE